MELLLIAFFAVVSGVSEIELRSQDFDSRIEHIEMAIERAEAGKLEINANPARRGKKLAKIQGKILRKQARLQIIKNLRDGKTNRRQLTN